MTASTRNSWQLALIMALWASACSEGHSPRAGLGAASGAGGTRSAAGAASPEGGGESVSGGAPSDAGQAPIAGQPGGGVADDGGAGSSAGAGAGEGGMPSEVEPLPEPTCVGSGELGSAVKLAISTAGADRFGSITPDELAIAWTVVDDGDVTLHYARRASVDDDFGAASTLALESAADDSVSLSADGLRLVYVNDDRKGFTQLVRVAVDEPFDAVDNRDFSPIAESAEQLAADEYLGDPVLGPDDSTFFYSRYGGSPSATLLGTLRFSLFAPWPAGVPLPLASSLETTAEARLRPTAMSLDSQTLFLWNEASARQIVARLSHETAEYEPDFELEDARGAAPNAGCSRVYFDRDGDLWTASF